MSDAKAGKSAEASPDLLNELLGLGEDSAVGALRAQRAEIASFIQGSYDVLLEPKNEAGVSRVERGLAALRVAVLEESAPLIAYYRNYLAEQNVSQELIDAAASVVLGDALSPRERTLLEHVDRLTNEPDVATSAHLAGLKAQGFSDANIVTISQLIAFLSFQVRVIVGLQLLEGAA